MTDERKVSEAFTFEYGGRKLTFDLAYECRKNPSLSPKFELRMQGKARGDQEEKVVFEGELAVEFHEYGHLEQHRYYADIKLKVGKPLEVRIDDWGGSFKGRYPSFWPTDYHRWEITKLTEKGYSVTLPSASLHDLRLEFLPREIRPPREIDM